MGIGAGGGAVVCYPQLGQSVGQLGREGVARARQLITGGELQPVSFSVPLMDPVVVVNTMMSSMQIMLSKCKEVYKMAVVAMQEAGQGESGRSTLLAEKSSKDDV